MRHLSLLSTLITGGAATLVACSGSSGADGGAGAALSSSESTLKNAGAKLYDIIQTPPELREPSRPNDGCIWNGDRQAFNVGKWGSVGDVVSVDFTPKGIVVTPVLFLNGNDYTNYGNSVIFAAGNVLDEDMTTSTQASYDPELDYFYYEVDRVTNGAPQLDEKMTVYRAFDQTLAFEYDSDDPASYCWLSPRTIGPNLQNAGVISYKVEKVTGNSGYCVTQGLTSWGVVGDYIAFDFTSSGVLMANTYAVGGEALGPYYNPVTFLTGASTTATTKTTGAFEKDQFTYQETDASTGNTLLAVTLVRSPNAMTYTTKMARPEADNAASGATTTSTCTLVAQTQSRP